MTDITSVVWPGHFLCCSVSEWPPPDTEPAQVRSWLPRLSVTQATSEHTTTALWCCRSSPRKAAYPVVWPLCPGDDLATVVAGDLPELRDAGARAALLLAILFSRARSQEACKTQPGLSHGDDTCKRFGYRPGVCQAEGLPVRMLILGALLDCLEHLSLHQKVDGFEGRKQQFEPRRPGIGTDPDEKSAAVLSRLKHKGPGPVQERP
jgi:hypothetical protein